MKKLRLIAGLSVLLLTVVFSMAFSSLLTGCEEAKGTHALTVLPSYVDLTATSTASNSATQTFTVTNGLRELSLPLEWSVSDPELGRIGAAGGYSASYIANTNKSGNNTIFVKDQYDAEGVATVRQ